jgi:hypothetical protein
MRSRSLDIGDDGLAGDRATHGGRRLTGSFVIATTIVSSPSGR